MEPSEAVSVTDHCEAPPSESQSPQFHGSVLDPAPSDSQHVASDDRIHAQLQNLDLKDEKEEAVKDYDQDGGWEFVKNPGEDEGYDLKGIDESDRFQSFRNEDGDGDEYEEVDAAGYGHGGEVERKLEIRAKNNQYPVRPDAEDCAFYLKTGTCKYGSFCKFNHPMRKRNQVVSVKLKYEDDSAWQASKTECKFYLTTGGCKFGKDCRFNHTRPKALANPILELNFLGLPIRPDERECPYYMRMGSCKYGANCRFNHPDPTTVAAPESSSGYNNNGVLLQAASQSQITSWTSPRVLNETATFVPAIISPSQDSEWNAYQAPIYPSEISVLTPPTYVMNNIAPETNLYPSHLQANEYPERPGQPECSYFLKTGDCKYKLHCKYHHPKNRNPKLPACTLNDKGLPLRPDQNACSYYSNYGICKFGPSCKFDHPILPASTTESELEHHSHCGNFTATEGAEVGAEASGSSATVEQSAC